MREETFPSIQVIDKKLKWIIAIIAVLMFLYHMLIVWHPVFEGYMNQNGHLGFSLVLLFFYWMKGAETLWKKGFQLCLALLSLALVCYMAYHYDRLTLEAGWPNTQDVIVGVFLITVVIISTWRSFGPTFPVMVLIVIAYAMWGHNLKGVLSHPRLEFGFIISNFSVGFQGIYGMLLNVSVNMLFLYLVFGALFEATGVTNFFLELGKLIGRHVKGGPGHTATFSSSFVGMVNGVAAANVAITGSYTIPMMKRAGFSGETAVGIEAMASTGGQLTPPVMGVAVFIMAGFLGVPYSELMLKALIPAIAFYASAVLGVILIANRRNIPKGTDIANKRVILFGFPIFVVPMTVLIIILFLHFSPGYSAFWAIIILLAISSLRRETRPTFQVFIRNVVSGSILGATIGVACACIGIFVKAMTFTGAATKLSLVITGISGGHLLPTLVLTMILSIVLGGSLPTVVAYIMVAFVAAPILLELGIRPEVSHFFVYYYAILASVTPPIANAAIVGAKIADCSYMRASWESMKLSAPFFLLPFFLIRNSVLLAEGSASLGGDILGLLALAIAMFSMTCFCQRFCLTNTGKLEKWLWLFISMSAVWYGLYGEIGFFIASCMMLICVIMAQCMKRRKGHVKACLSEG